jgi:hypothetical protein
LSSNLQITGRELFYRITEYSDVPGKYETFDLDLDPSPNTVEEDVGKEEGKNQNSRKGFHTIRK